MSVKVPLANQSDTLSRFESVSLSEKSDLIESLCIAPNASGMRNKRRIFKSTFPPNECIQNCSTPYKSEIIVVT